MGSSRVPSFDTESTFAADEEFAKLLVRQDDVDLEVAALELARDRCPSLDFGDTLKWFDARAQELAGPMARADNEQDMLESLAGCLSGSHGLTGSAEAFRSVEGSFLSDVIASGRGIPISLSLIYMAVARRLKIRLEGVAAPVHFLCRLDAPAGPLFVDAFSSGRVMELDECLAWLNQLTGLTHEQLVPALSPAQPRQIIQRMLNNLKALYIDQENWKPALSVQQRLTLLEPASYAQRRDLALVTLKAGHPDRALGMLQSCAKSAPSDDLVALEKLIDQARSDLAAWN
jgi:regulator of sirC expression with transglutaminase-like and TPR domain